MAAVVINHLTLDVPVEEIADVIDRKMSDVIRTLPGFQQFYFVRTAERQGTIVIVWASEEEAVNGGAVLGPTLFNEYIFPHLTAPQDRRVGKVVAEASR